MIDLQAAVDRVVAGDPSAFEEIVQATSDRLVRLGARMLGSQADAEDVVQDAYVKAYQALRAGRLERGVRVQTWLYRIVTNGSIDALRTRKRRSSSDEMPDPGYDGAAWAEAHLALRELDDWLRVLPADQRAAVTLKYLEGFTSAEVAEILSTSEGAVEQRLVRARSALRKREEESHV
jgi:RNA polymerase sigma-70 factor, ECF subfamily